MAINDLKQRLKEEYQINSYLIERYLRNDNDFDSAFLKARERNNEIVNYLQRVCKMNDEEVERFLCD